MVSIFGAEVRFFFRLRLRIGKYLASSRGTTRSRTQKYPRKSPFGHVPNGELHIFGLLIVRQADAETALRSFLVGQVPQHDVANGKAFVPK